MKGGKMNLLQCNRAVAVCLGSDAVLGGILVQLMKAASFFQALI